MNHTVSISLSSIQLLNLKSLGDLQFQATKHPSTKITGPATVMSFQWVRAVVYNQEIPEFFVGVVSEMW